MKRNWASELRAIAGGRLLLNVRNGVTVSRSMLAMIADELDAERAAHAETKRALADYQRATNTVDAHETANVSDKPSFAQELADRSVESFKVKTAPAPGGQQAVAYGVKASNTMRISSVYLARDYEEEGLGDYRKDLIVPLYTRPSEQAVTEAMVVAATEEYFAASFKNTPSDAMRIALKAAMEAGG